MKQARRIFVKARDAARLTEESNRARRRRERAEAIAAPVAPPKRVVATFPQAGARTVTVKRANGRFQVTLPSGRMAFGKTAEAAYTRAQSEPQNWRDFRYFG